MSELTTCNYCNYQRIKQNAKKQNKKIVKRYVWDGVNIYVVPKDIKIPKIIKDGCKELPNGDEFHETYFRMWFMELPSHCCC